MKFNLIVFRMVIYFILIIFISIYSTAPIKDEILISFIIIIWIAMIACITKLLKS